MHNLRMFPVAAVATPFLLVSCADLDHAAVSASLPCVATITGRPWNNGKKELTVKASCTTSATTIQVLADGAFIGNMTLDGAGFVFKKRLSARPACVEIAASCGGQATSCF